MRPYFGSNGAWTEFFSMGKSCWRNGGLTTLCGHGKWLFEKIGQVSEKQRIWELQSEPQIREAYLRKKLQKIVIAPSLWGLVPAWGTIIRWFFFHFSSGLNREVKVSKVKSDTRKNKFFFNDQQKKKTNPFQVPFELKSWPEVRWKNGNELKYPICMCGLSAHPEEKRPVRMTDLWICERFLVLEKNTCMSQAPQHHSKKITSRGNAGRNPWKKSSVTRRH